MFLGEQRERVTGKLPHLAGKNVQPWPCAWNTDVMHIMKYNWNEAGFTPVAMALVPMCTGGERLARWLRSVWVCVRECPVQLENNVVNNHRSLKPFKKTNKHLIIYLIQLHCLCVSVFLFNQQMCSSLLDYFLFNVDNWPEPEKGTVVSISQLAGAPSRAGIALSLGAGGVAGSSLIQAISHHPICCSISLDSATTAFIWLSLFHSQSWLILCFWPSVSILIPSVFWNIILLFV